MIDRLTPPRPSGLRMRELCEREGISRATGWRWVSKGVLDVSRQAPRTGVRVSYHVPSAQVGPDEPLE